MKRLFTALFMVMLIAAGCSSASDDAAVSSASESEVAEAEAEAAAAPESNDDTDDSADTDDSDDSADTGDSAMADTDDTPMAASSPIGAFFNDGGGFEQSIADYTVKVEEQIVICMANEGFEFRQSTPQRSEIQRLQNELTEREWTKLYGYGISTSFDSFVQDQGADPNAELFFSMQAGERDAWVSTLAGENANLAGGGPGQDTPLEEQGCVGEAIIATGGQEIFEGLDELGTSYQEGLDGINDKPEMIDAIGAWTRCLSEAGYPNYSEPDALRDDISDRLDKLTVGLDAAIDSLSPEDGQALVAGDAIELEDLPGFDVEGLRKLQEEEVKLAVADLDCFDTHVADVFLPLRDAFERGLLDEYQSELGALKNIGG